MPPGMAARLKHMAFDVDTSPRTVYALFQRTVESHPERTALQVRAKKDFLDVSYAEVDCRVRRVAAALLSFGLSKGDRVALIAENMPRWLYADLACLALGVVDVPRGADCPPEELEYILKDSGARIVFVQDQKGLERVKAVHSQLPDLEKVIVMEEGFDATSEMVSAMDALLSQGELPGDAERLAEAMAVPSAADLATIIYTSGTSGVPKGVMLSHRNLLHNPQVIGDVMDLNPEDRLLSILPPWHAFERVVEYATLSIGASFAYSKPELIARDFPKIKPTLMASVPRVWEAVYQKIMKKLQEEKGFKAHLFNFFVEVGRRYVRATDILNENLPVFEETSASARVLAKACARIEKSLLSPFYHMGDRQVFSALRAVTGGALRGAVSGGAALPGHIDEFFRVIGLPVLEGYGLSETGPGITFRSPRRNTPFTTGRALPGVDVEIINEACDRLRQGEEGEIRVSGPNVMLGYWQKPQETSEVLKREEGKTWFYTGDLGRMDIRGNLQITGRKKDLLKLANGEYVAPEPLEQLLKQSPYIEHVVAVGQDQKFVGMLIVPRFEAVAEHYALSHGLKEGPIVEWLAQGKGDVKNIPAAVQDIVQDASTLKLFHSIVADVKAKHPKQAASLSADYVALIPEPFEVGKQLTNTLKVKRRVVHQLYQDLIKGLYA